MTWGRDTDEHEAADQLKAFLEAGGTLLFLAPGFYHGAETVDDLVNFIVARALDQLGLDVGLAKRWGSQ